MLELRVIVLCKKLLYFITLWYFKYKSYSMYLTILLLRPFVARLIFYLLFFSLSVFLPSLFLVSISISLYRCAVYNILLLVIARISTLESSFYTDNLANYISIECSKSSMPLAISYSSLFPGHIKSGGV